jgi:hypothetical protein
MGSKILIDGVFGANFETLILIILAKHRYNSGRSFGPRRLGLLRREGES